MLNVTPAVDFRFLVTNDEDEKQIEEKSDNKAKNGVDLDDSYTNFIYTRFNKNGNIDDIDQDPDFEMERNTYHLNYRFNIKHNLDNGEKILERFNCAIKQKIIVQGYLFISTEALYFFSYWNDESYSKFFSYGIHRCTRIKIMYKDIEKIEKAANAFIFDNSLRITIRTPKPKPHRKNGGISESSS